MTTWDAPISSFTHWANHYYTKLLPLSSSSSSSSSFIPE
ncbi:Uncharacterized protein APZ42_024605 [Daphnia magna]|uniref:Uncharacterized protein n=1 Tax=Daphnia magna TaxID=35525 RepID=A0A164TWJ6_9CRUS|nr:Uncharacterized protein APZ42_024605 [Daphnia magna]